MTNKSQAWLGLNGQIKGVVCTASCRTKHLRTNGISAVAHCLRGTRLRNQYLLKQKVTRLHGFKCECDAVKFLRTNSGSHDG